MTISADDAVDRVLSRRNELLGTKYVVTSRPDKTNRGTRDIDAIAESEGQPSLAIEHTQLPTFDQQMREDAWFRDSIVPIERELDHRYDPFRVELTFHYVRGDRWPKGAVAIVRNWLDANLPGMPVHKGNKAGPDSDIPGIGLVRIYKKASRLPGLFVSRTVPTNVAFVDEGLGIMNVALNHKYEELTEYRKRGYVSIMLLDSRDIALTNDLEQYKLYLRSCVATPRDGLDEVWLADIWESVKDPKDDCVAFYCFKAATDLMEAANPEGFCFGPAYDGYWRGVIEEEDRQRAAEE